MKSVSQFGQRDERESRVDARVEFFLNIGRKLKSNFGGESRWTTFPSQKGNPFFDFSFNGCVRLGWISPSGKRCKIGRGGGKKVRKKETNGSSFFFFLSQSFFFAARLIRGVKNGTVFLQEVALKPWAGKNGERKAGLTLVPRPSRPWWYSACLERTFFHGKFGRWLSEELRASTSLPLFFHFSSTI